MSKQLLAIGGIGGFAQNLYWTLPKEDQALCYFFVSDEALPLISQEFRRKYKVTKKSNIIKNIDKYSVIIAVENITERKKLVDSMPKDTNFGTYIHTSAQIQDPNTKIGKGSIICAGTVITSGVVIGNHAQINVNSMIGHNCVIGDYFTCAPGVNLLGQCTIGERVYIGTNSSVEEGIGICDDVMIGFQTGVNSTITEGGVYSGNPLQRVRTTKNPE